MTTDKRKDAKRKPMIYRCAQCGEIAHYGFKVNIRAGQDGEWFCFAHKPDKQGETKA